MIGAAGLTAAALIVGRFLLYYSTRKLLPPTSFSPSHLEQSPPSQINLQPIPYLIQEHMMERGGGPHRVGSMLVQYNCDDYQCDPDMVEKLEALVGRYPPQVYLAPFPGMDAKIALAAPGPDLSDKVAIQALVVAQRAATAATAAGQPVPPAGCAVL